MIHFLQHFYLFIFFIIFFFIHFSDKVSLSLNCERKPKPNNDFFISGLVVSLRHLAELFFACPFSQRRGSNQMAIDCSLTLLCAATGLGCGQVPRPRTERGPNTATELFTPNGLKELYMNQKAAHPTSACQPLIAAARTSPHNDMGFFVRQLAQILT